ncbi:unnamed protein product [Phytophthora fragariaefolia]|uniref:Unnamed protein product n=1 Tax=Phytophthora fragariaefolia TaxID=1490495 RepID=A0A9W6XQ22_9STRA|nr:unnamed protein product [Phytophthora fragariaefolia]
MGDDRGGGVRGEKISELYKILGTVMDDTIADIDSIFNVEPKMNLQAYDVKARIINYIMRCDEIIMQHGVAGIFAGIKEKCQILTAHLELAAPHEAVNTPPSPASIVVKRT